MTQRSLEFPPSTTTREIEALRARIAALFLLDGVAPAGSAEGRLEPLLRTERPALSQLSEALAGEGGGDLLRLLESVYPGGSLLERRLPVAAPSYDVALRWLREGEHYVARTAESREAFVHPDLGPALEAALTEFVRTHLLDPSLLAAPAAERRAHARRIETLERGWRQLSERLAAIENRRLALWKKPKLVLESRWCVCVGLVPRALWNEVLASGAQRREWSDLFGLEVPEDEAEGRAFLEAHPTLPVDTSHMAFADGERLLEALGDLERVRDGVMIEGDNAHALTLLAPRFAGQVQMVYMDPPFNTESGGFAYDDRYRRASWLCFMEERLLGARQLLRPDGTLYAHIDQHEKERLRLLLDKHLEYVTEIIWRIGWLSGFKTRANKFIRNHDTIYQYGRTSRPLFNKTYLPYPDGYVRRDGKPPTGLGIPLEDTWNCSAADRLDSIQIMSFSREKVGRGDLTQKNENLLERMLEASSRPGDWVLDHFQGSGTTAAAAHKMGRRWIGVERGAPLLAIGLSRLKRVLFGDKYGISKARGWSGGGAFQVLRLESYDDALANLRGRGREARHHLSLHFQGDRLRLRSEVLAKPLRCRVRAIEGGWRSVDVAETFSWLLGLTVLRRRRARGAHLVAGTDPSGRPVLVVWLRPSEEQEADAASLPEVLLRLTGELAWTEGRAFLNAPLEGLEPLLPGWLLERTEVAFDRLLSDRSRAGNLET